MFIMAVSNKKHTCTTLVRVLVSIMNLKFIFQNLINNCFSLIPNDQLLMNEFYHEIVIKVYLFQLFNQAFNSIIQLHM